MDFHVLNGDALTDRFLALRLEGKVIVTREAFISGSLEGITLGELYKTRANYLIGPSASDLQQYYAFTVAEFDKICTAKEGDRFFLWFGYDLFCFINMLFIISRISSLNIPIEIKIVYPSFLSEEKAWDDFGRAGVDKLRYSLDHSIKLSEEDQVLAGKLWTALRETNFELIDELSRRQSTAFPYLRVVCKAHLDRFPGHGRLGKPEKIINEIIRNGKKDFSSLFVDFQKSEGVYGFGDVQVKEIYDRVIGDHKK
ncbi:hypothetical protein [Pollutibacter soli]|uniref:hypothetical protein n=1 Tax=Pollutibacter soli TaxID=3034157 RepID=UPI00301339AC